MNRTSQQNPLPISARHLTAGDYFFDWMVSSWQRTGSSKEFTLITPGRANSFTLTVKAEKLDDVVFPVHKRGDSHSPTARNRAMGLPDDLDRPEPPKPAEPIEIYTAGTRIENVRYFDRSIKVAFACPDHPRSKWVSKDPHSSTIFAQSDETIDCTAGEAGDCKVDLDDYILTHEYKPTRNG